jgi:PAS domain-containing protein
VDYVGREIGEKQQALNLQKDEYQRLFELVPCIISVQDRNYRLISYNREFSKRFAPQPGDFCYTAYKGRTEKCKRCPVEKTFQDGRPHYSEETGINKDDTLTHWIVKTAAMKDESGDIIDNGVGMDKAVRENLFDLFFSSKGHRGTGLGLFVAHNIITQHQGTKRGRRPLPRGPLPSQQDPQTQSE